MSALSPEDLDGVEDGEVLTVDVPEWKGTVYLRVLPADVGIDMNERMQALPKDKQGEGIFILVGTCMAKPDGSALFSTPEQARKTLGKRNLAVLLRLQSKAVELNGLSGTPGKGSSGVAGAASPTA